MTEDKRRKIYVVDDDENIRLIICRYLEKEGYLVSAFESAESAYQAYKTDMPDMIIMDIMMPGTDGYELCKRIRAESNVPIIMVSAKDDEVDKIVGLELGSDDYMSKPFSPRELVARIKTVFRRMDVALASGLNQTAVAEHHGIRIQDLELLEDERIVISNGTRISLTTKEFDMLWFLATNQHKVFNRDQLLTQVWGYDHFGDERAVDDLVKRLRKKMKEVGTKIEIKTVYGYGYKLES